LSWYSPKPKQKPKRLPRRRPIKVVPSAIGDQGIVANYLMYYLKGGDHLQDFSGGYHGTLTSSGTDRPTWVSTRRGWALKFDGADDYVEIPDSATNGLDTFTFAAWVRPDEVSGNYAILAESWSRKMIRIYNNDFCLDITDTAGNAYRIHTGSPKAGNWYFQVGTYDTGTGVMRLYVNGDQIGSLDIGTVDVGDNSNAIGREGALDANYFNGIITEVRVYSVAKSTSWIERRFERTKGIFGL